MKPSILLIRNCYLFALPRQFEQNLAAVITLYLRMVRLESTRVCLLLRLLHLEMSEFFQVLLLKNVGKLAGFGDE